MARTILDVCGTSLSSSMRPDLVAYKSWNRNGLKIVLAASDKKGFSTPLALTSTVFSISTSKVNFR